MSAKAAAVRVSAPRRPIRVPLWPIYMAPAFLIIAYVVIYPVIRSIYLSFFHVELVSPDDQAFIGLQNFADILADAAFRQSLINTIIFTAGTVVVSFVLGLGFSLIVEGLPERLSAIRGLLMGPWVTPPIVVGFLFLYMFDQELGVVNLVFRALNLISRNLAWLSTGNLAMIAVILANIWSQTPLFLLMFAAGLTAIPTEQKESMRMDGANALREFWHLTVPYLRNIMIVASLLEVIRNFNNFPVIWTMTQGGPVYSTTTLAIFIYRLSFQQFKFGYGSAVGVIWLLVLLGFSALYIRLLRRETI